MYTIRCTCCGAEQYLPGVLRCPVCNKELAEFTDEHARKHILGCIVSTNPRMYSLRKRGRPSKMEVAENIRNRLKEDGEDEKRDYRDIRPDK